jgi:protein SDA1
MTEHRTAKSLRPTEELLENLPALQNLIKRDPESYREEFAQQWRHFEAQLAIFNLKPDSLPDPEFGNLVMFLAHVSLSYKKETATLPTLLIELLTAHYAVVDPELRMTMVKSLILMRNKDLVKSERYVLCC